MFFGWLGPLTRVVAPDSETSNSGMQNIDFIDIPNETSDWIKIEIEK